MKLYTHLTSTTSSASLWLADHPAMLRMALVALPLLLALAAALMTNSPAYASPTGGGGGTTGG